MVPAGDLERVELDRAQPVEDGEDPLGAAGQRPRRGEEVVDREVAPGDVRADDPRLAARLGGGRVCLCPGRKADRPWPWRSSAHRRPPNPVRSRHVSPVPRLSPSASSSRSTNGDLGRLHPAARLVRAEPGDTVDLRERLPSAAPRRPLHLEGVGDGGGRVEIALDRPGVDDLAALLDDRAERDRRRAVGLAVGAGGRPPRRTRAGRRRAGPRRADPARPSGSTNGPRRASRRTARRGGRGGPRGRRPGAAGTGGCPRSA